LISKPDFYSLGLTLIPEIFMARLSRFVMPGQVQHVIVRGKQPHPECVGRPQIDALFERDQQGL